LDKDALEALKSFPEKIAASIERYRFREALSFVMDFARAGNKYLAETEPWKTIKDDRERTATILNIALNFAANLAIVAEPFLPFTSAKIFGMFGLKGLKWSDAGSHELLETGQQINEAALLFDKIEDSTVEAQIQKLLDTKKQNEIANAVSEPMKDIISYDDFAKLDMRVVKVLTAEPMPKSKKLLRLTVDTGLGVKTVLSGVAEHFKPEDLIGKQVTMLINLAPRKIMGIDSEGMILMAEDRDGSLRLLQPNTPTSEGSTIS
jgi:methionyl-tRNA synthetase